jgi:hypothetical protein
MTILPMQLIWHGDRGSQTCGNPSRHTVTIKLTHYPKTDGGANAKLF